MTATQNTPTEANYGQDRARLHASLWKVAHQLRGTIDGWDFKNCTLSILTYIHLSERFSQAMEGRGYVPGTYSEHTEEIPEETKREALAEFGFFLAPEHTYQQVINSKNEEGALNTYEALKAAFNAIQYPTGEGTGEGNYRGLFSSSVDFFVRMAEEEGLGSESLSIRIRDILTSLYDTITTNSIDSFGDAYEYLMGMYASEAGKSGGEYFTPQSVSAVLTRIASAQNPAFGTPGRYPDTASTPTSPQENIKVYDPTCGSGSLLLNFARLSDHRIRYYGQEKSNTTYNFARMNMLMHEIEHDQFSIMHGDTLATPKQHDGLTIREQEGLFDAVVSNPPYSVQWNNTEAESDPRFIHGVAPASRADLAFTQHILYTLKDTGTAAIVEFPGMMYRGNVEQEIRKSLLEANVVDAVIRLPEGVFYGTSIPTCILILRKDRGDYNEVLFMDATPLRLKQGDSNILTKAHQDAIVEGYVKNEDAEGFIRKVTRDEIADNNYDLSPENYVSGRVVVEHRDIGVITAELEELSLEQGRLNEALQAARATLLPIGGVE